jgi:hypothetical protein
MLPHSSNKRRFTVPVPTSATTARATATPMDRALATASPTDKATAATPTTVAIATAGRRRLLPAPTGPPVAGILLAVATTATPATPVPLPLDPGSASTPSLARPTTSRASCPASNKLWSGPVRADPGPTPAGLHHHAGASPWTCVRYRSTASCDATRTTHMGLLRPHRRTGQRRWYVIIISSW